MRSRNTGDNRSFVSSARRAQIVEAAIETVAEVGYANASLSRIAVRLGISKGVISYHFAGKDDLIAEIVRQVLQQARAYMQPRIEAQTTGPEMLHAYIESNLEFMRDNPNQLSALVEIVRATIAGPKYLVRVRDACLTNRMLKPALRATVAVANLGSCHEPEPARRCRRARLAITCHAGNAHSTRPTELR